MKKLLILVLIFGGAYVLYDLQAVRLSLNEKLRFGTLSGLEACVSYSQSELASSETTRNVCSERLQTNLYDSELATGRAGPDVNGGLVSLGGTLENKSATYVTTWVNLYFSLFDENGENNRADVETYLWIEPNSSADFSVSLPNIKPEDLKSVDFCDYEDKEPKSCMIWGVSGIKGVSL